MTDSLNQQNQTAPWPRIAPAPLGMPPLRVDFAALSDLGKVRTNNEDQYLISRWARSMETMATSLAIEALPKFFEETGYAFVVADGLGGQAAGEVASGLAIETLIAVALERAKWALRVDQNEAPAIIERIRGFVREVDRIIYERAEADPKLQGMGTTLSVAMAAGRELLLFHVGDSRVYRLRDGKLTRLTRDQTMAQDLEDMGLLTPEKAARHRLRHVLTQAVGRREGMVEVAADWRTVKAGDVLLLCTDGLTEHLNDAEIEPVLAAHVTASDTCRALVDQALAGGGRDNVTVVVARFSAA